MCFGDLCTDGRANTGPELLEPVRLKSSLSHLRAAAHVFDNDLVTDIKYRNSVKPDAVPTGRMGAIPVIARLVCPDGSEEWWPARAVRWTATSVLIGFETEPGDHRSLRYLWLAVDDVARVIRPASTATTGSGE